MNKADQTGRENPDIYEFYNLGLGDPIAVSAVHGHGTGDLLDACFAFFPPEDEVLPERSSILATSWSEAVIPVLMSQTKTITVAAPMAISACSRMKERIWSSVPGSMPPVSTMSKTRLRHSHWAYSRSRVTPGVSSTMDSRWPQSLLNSMDLPTLGRPTMATKGFILFLLFKPPLSKRLLIPANMLRSGEDVFLDDVSTADVERELGVPVVPVPQDGYELLDAICGVEPTPEAQRQAWENEEFYRYNP